jgi:hypothetical protein
VITIPTKDSCDILNGVPPLSSGQEISIYPNPAQDILYVVSAYDLAAVRITDMLGRQLLHSYNRSGYHLELDIRTLLPGAYLLEVQTQQGYRFVLRWVKE